MLAHLECNGFGIGHRRSCSRMSNNLKNGVAEFWYAGAVELFQGGVMQ
jgi:hypothetical protein